MGLMGFMGLTGCMGLMGCMGLTGFMGLTGRTDNARIFKKTKKREWKRQVFCIPLDEGEQ